MCNEEIIENLFKMHKITLNSTQINQFYRYFELLIEYNKQFNLTSITDFKEVIVKHFIDSVLNYTYFKQNATICDMGSGAGFPGIPLKIMRPDLSITLVDSLNKRVNFLNNVIKELNLTQIAAIHSRAQELQNIVSRETFDYITARAVAPLNILLELCIPYLKINGEMIALKSINYNEEINNAKNALKLLDSSINHTEEYTLNNTNDTYQRAIIYITKNDRTDLKYPRQKNKITLQPL